MNEAKRLAGRTVLVGVHGTELDRSTGQRRQSRAPAGVILFSRNLASARQTVRLLRELRRLLPYPLLLALDQYLRKEKARGRIHTESPHEMAFLIVSAIHNGALFEALCGPVPQMNEQAVRTVIGCIWEGLEPRGDSQKATQPNPSGGEHD